MKFLAEFHHCCLLASVAEEEGGTSVVPSTKYSCKRNGFIRSNNTSRYRNWRPGLSVISETDAVPFSNATTKKKTKASTKPKSMLAKPRSSYGHGNHNNFHNRNESMEMMIPGFAPAPFIF